jgi:hypothetical protein
MILAKRPFVPALLLGAALAAPEVRSEDLTVVFKETGQNAGTSSQYFTKDRVRHNSPGQDTIFEYSTGKITNSDHKKKEYYEVTLAEIEAQMTAMSAEMEKANAQMQEQLKNAPPAMREQMEKMMGGIAGAINVTKGGTRKVAGYDCQEYTITMGTGIKNDTCNSTAIEFPIPEADLKRFASMSKGMGALMSSPMGKGFAQMAEKMKDVQGFSLAETTTISLMGRTQTSGREAVEVKKGAVDPAVFALPTGYKQVKAPGMKKS